MTDKQHQQRNPSVQWLYSVFTNTYMCCRDVYRYIKLIYVKTSSSPSIPLSQVRKQQQENKKWHAQTLAVEVHCS